MAIVRRFGGRLTVPVPTLAAAFVLVRYGFMASPSHGDGNLGLRPVAPVGMGVTMRR